MVRTYLSLVILAAVFLTACGGANTVTPTANPAVVESTPNTVSAEGTLLPEHAAELAFAQGGVVKEILVQQGERIAQGDVILRLVGFKTAQAELAAAELEQVNAQQALDALNENASLVKAQAELVLANAVKALDDEEYRWRVQQKGNRASPETIREAEAKLTLAEDEVSHWQGIYDLASGDSAKAMALVQLTQAKRNRDSALRSLNWYKGNPTTEDQAILDSKLAVAKAQLEDARRKWEEVKDGPNADDVAVTQTRLKLAQAHLAAAQDALELYELHAPFNAELFYLDLSVGETAPPMTPIAFLADTSHWIIKTKDLAEVDVSRISIGDPATVRLDAFPNEEFKGTVTEINPVGRLYLGDMTYQITIMLDEPDPRFLWNMTATVTVNADGN